MRKRERERLNRYLPHFGETLVVPIFISWRAEYANAIGLDIARLAEDSATAGRIASNHVISKIIVYIYIYISANLESLCQYTYFFRGSSQVLHLIFMYEPHLPQDKLECKFLYIIYHPIIDITYI